MTFKAGLILAAALTAISGAASAQTPAAPPPPVPAAKGPPLALAIEAGQTAIATCAASGYKVSVVVLDTAGVVKAVMVGDAAAARTVGIATRKANTALAYKVSTGAIGERVKTDTALAAKIAADPTMITWQGGLPIMAGGELLGAIAASGAPGGDKDEACVNAGMAKIKARL